MGRLRVETRHDGQVPRLLPREARSGLPRQPNFPGSLRSETQEEEEVQKTFVRKPVQTSQGGNLDPAFQQQHRLLRCQGQLLRSVSRRKNFQPGSEPGLSTSLPTSPPPRSFPAARAFQGRGDELRPVHRRVQRVRHRAGDVSAEEVGVAETPPQPA